MVKRLAITKDGQLTYCTADDEHIGRGRCNHLAHQLKNETCEDFIRRMESEYKARENDEMNDDKVTSKDPYEDLPEEDRPESVTDIDMAKAILKALSKTEHAEELNKSLASLEEYSHHVANMTLRIKMLRFRIDDFGIKEYQERVMQLDRERKSKHTIAIGKVARINDLCESAGLPPFYQGDVDVNDREARHELADFIFRLYDNPLM